MRCSMPTGASRTGPLALCEVQGYVYGAQDSAPRASRARSVKRRAPSRWSRPRRRCRRSFNSAFWCEDIETFALALDGDKQPCRVRTSNPGHCLYTGIAHAERARQVIAGSR